MATDDEVSRPVTAGIIWAFVAVSTLFVAARLYTRLRIVNKIGLDDYIMVVSWICTLLFAALVTASIHWGMGEHANDLSAQQQEKALLYSAASFAPGILAFTIPKLGVTALLIRILNPTPRFTLCLWLFVGTIDIIIFGCVIIQYAQCSPVRTIWIPALRAEPGTRCWSGAVLADYSIAAGALSAFVDLFLAVYPATVLWKLQMNRKKKMGLTIILGMGIFACAISIYKATRLTGLDAADYTYSSFSVFLWTSIEGNTIIIAACIPTIAPLLESIFGRRVFYNQSTEEPSSYIRNQYRKNKNKRHHHNNNNNTNQSASVTLGRDDVGERGSSTLVISTSDSRGRTANSKNNHKTDVESQTSILEEDYDYDHDYDHDHYGDDTTSIPMDHISRRDEFRIEYDERRMSSMTDEDGRRRSENNHDNNRPRALVNAWRRSLTFNNK